MEMGGAAPTPMDQNKGMCSCSSHNIKGVDHPKQEGD